MLVKYYNIHNIVKFKIITQKRFKWNLKNIYGSFENFEDNKNDETDFEVHLGNFKPENNNCHILENNYYIKDDYFYCKKDRYKFTNWEFEINGIDNDNTVIKISSNFFGYLWMAGFIIEFFIHYKMNRKGYPLIHASALSYNNKGYIFSARGGGGKTTISMNLLSNGFKLLGDNFVVLNKNKVFSYFSPLNIFSYNLVPIINSKLNSRDKLMLKIKNIIYKLSFGFVKIFTKINPKVILADYTIDSAKITKIFLLLSKNEFKVEMIDKEELCDYLIFNQMLDSLLFLPYIFEYSYVYPDSFLAKHWNLYKKNLLNNISENIKIYKVELPKNTSKFHKNFFHFMEE
ncbi:MAG: hypothetical protein Kow0019_15750 [Methanobacteriaceae archaeon]